jgi:hypothetical protein
LDRFLIDSMTIPEMTAHRVKMNMRTARFRRQAIDVATTKA